MKNESNNDATTVATIERNNPLNLIELAITSNAPVEQLERLFDLQERFEKKEAAKAFKMAFAQFQGEKPSLEKSKQVKFQTKTGGMTNYKYMPLAKIQELIDPILSKFGLSYRWEPKQSAEGVSITCIISHVDGHEERTTLSAMNDISGGKNPIQSIGSSVSYLKRYTLEGAFGLSSDEDTDGATKAKNQQQLDTESSILINILSSINKCNNLNELESYYKGLEEAKRNDTRVRKAVNEMKEVFLLDNKPQNETKQA